MIVLWSEILTLVGENSLGNEDYMFMQLRSLWFIYSMKWEKRLCFIVLFPGSQTVHIYIVGLVPDHLNKAGYNHFAGAVSCLQIVKRGNIYETE